MVITTCQVDAAIDSAERAYDARAAEAVPGRRSTDVYTFLWEIDDHARAVAVVEPLVAADVAASCSDAAARRRALGLCALKSARRRRPRRRLMYVGETVRGAPTRTDDHVAVGNVSPVGGLVEVDVAAGVRRRMLLWDSTPGESKALGLVLEMLAAVAVVRVGELVNLVACGWRSIPIYLSSMIKLAARFRGARGGMARANEVEPRRLLQQ